MLIKVLNCYGRAAINRLSIHFCNGVSIYNAADSTYMNNISECANSLSTTML